MRAAFGGRGGYQQQVWVPVPDKPGFQRTFHGSGGGGMADRHKGTWCAVLFLSGLCVFCAADPHVRRLSGRVCNYAPVRRFTQEKPAFPYFLFWRPGSFTGGRDLRDVWRC